MTKTYKATVEGQIRNVKGFDDKQNLELTDGRYTFERLNYNPPGQPPDEPTGDVFSWPLLEVARLRRENDDWYLNDEILPLEKWMQLELQKLFTKRGIPQQHRTNGAQLRALLRSKPGELPPDYVTRALLDTRVRRLPPDVRSQINGVAWFKHDDGAGGRNTPVFLQSFREIVQIVPAKVVKPGKHKAAKTRRSKPVARFEKDYAVAVIPSKTKGNDLCLELEPELRTLVKEITDVGGRLSRKDATRQFITKHGKANSENYQPEKLLRSKTAKALIKAGLLGTDKPSRTSMFWAKKRAV